ncbi:MAG: MFS transporter [Pseudomonadota bacterium]
MQVIRIVLPFTLGYFLSYAVRNVNAVIAPDLVADLHLTSASLGLLTSTYFLAFAAFQLPLGILLDRYGPRRVEAVLFLFAASGCALFAFSQSLYGLVAARALIGIGVSGALMGAFKAYVQWFPPARLPLVNGLTMTCGGFGALAATQPVESLLSLTDWRGVLLLMALFALCVSIIVFVVVPRHASERATTRESWTEQVAGLKTVFSSSQFWRIAPLTVTSQAAFLAIQGLWAGPWFRDVAGLDRDAVAEQLLLITVAMVLGFLSVGVLTERLSRIGVSQLVAATGCCVFAVGALGLIIWMPEYALMGPWLVFGFFGGAGYLFYSILTTHFPTALAGRAITCANVLTFSGAFVAQWSIGVVIGWWPETGPGRFDPAGYAAGFALYFAIILVSTLWLVLAPRWLGRAAR